MKTLGWLIAAAVMAIGAWMEYGGPVRGAAPAGDVMAGTIREAKPVAFDANHRPVPMRAETAGTSLVLILDGANLERVQWPVTVDFPRQGR